MRRGIDHLVLCVRDLEVARERYRSLGFALTPPGRHPFGTANSLVQFRSNYLELLTVADPSMIPPPAPGIFSFGAINRDVLDRREGFSMLALQTDDAEADAAEFRAKGIGPYASFRFERQARQPDGSEATVAFSLAFAANPAMPEIAFFTCRHHAPQFFWKPEYQRHDNGALDVREVVIAAANPSLPTHILEQLFGPRRVKRTATGLRAETGSGAVSVMSPEMFSERFPGGLSAQAPATPHFAAFVVEVADLDRARAVLLEGGATIHQSADQLVLPADHAFGVTIAFVDQESKR